MKFKYLPETDSLFIILSDNKSIESIEITDRVVADLDKDGKLIGIEFYLLKDNINLEQLQFEELQFTNINFGRF